MSPIVPTFGADLPGPVNISLPFSSDKFTTLSANLAGLPQIVDFNGTLTSLPLSRWSVGVQQLTIQHDLGFRHHPPALCSQDLTLPLLRDKFGADGLSYFDAVCSGIRHIQASIFYPACKINEPDTHTGKVFTGSLLEIITKEVFRDSEALHNMWSPALVNSSVCPGNYTMLLLTPPIGGQRQAYTQFATELVSVTNQVVVTVDHAYQSGAVELDNHTVFLNLAGELIKPRESNYARVVDLLAISNHLYNHSNLDQSTWDLAEIIPNGTVVLGHGQGGMVAQMMVGSNIFSAGGTLDGLIAMPAPYTEKNVLWQNRTSNLPKPILPIPDPRLPHPPPPHRPDGSMLDRLKRMARGLQNSMMDSLSKLMCRVFGTCGTLAHKRGLPAADYSLHTTIGRSRNHYYDEEKRTSDLCFYNCELQCEPRVPHGVFPDIPSQQGKTRDDDDWESAWEKYHNDPSLGDYQGEPGRRPYAGYGESDCYDPTHCFELCYPKYPENNYRPGRPGDKYRYRDDGSDEPEYARKDVDDWDDDDGDDGDYGDDGDDNDDDDDGDDDDDDNQSTS